MCRILLHAFENRIALGGKRQLDIGWLLGLFRSLLLAWSTRFRSIDRGLPGVLWRCWRWGLRPRQVVDVPGTCRQEKEQHHDPDDTDRLRLRFRRFDVFRPSFGSAERRKPERDTWGSRSGPLCRRRSPECNPTVSHIGQVTFAAATLSVVARRGSHLFPQSISTSSGSPPSSVGVVAGNGRPAWRIEIEIVAEENRPRSGICPCPVSSGAARFGPWGVDVLRAWLACLRPKVCRRRARLLAQVATLGGEAAAAGLADARAVFAGAPTFIGAPQNGQTSASSSRTDWRQDGQDGRSIQCPTLICA